MFSSWEIVRISRLFFHFMHTGIYTWKKARIKFVRNTQQTNQKSERPWKYVVCPIRVTNYSTLQWKAISARLSVRQYSRRIAKIFFPWRNNRWRHRWARKQKHENKDRQRRKPAKKTFLSYNKHRESVAKNNPNGKPAVEKTVRIKTYYWSIVH